MSRTVPPAARETFDEIAAQYDEARPGYPAAVYDDLILLTELSTNARLFEIGSGTGHATLPLAKRGFHIDCIELGKQMAAVARAKLAHFPGVTVTIADFDHWTTGKRYELAFSASAYHWLNPQTRVPHIAALLAPAGHVAVFRNHHVWGEASARFNAAASRIYCLSAPTLATRLKGLSGADEISPRENQEWLASGFFAHAQSRVYQWQQELSTEAYIRMLATHSDHRLLPEAERTRLFDELRNLIDSKFDGSVVKEYATLLQVAQKAQ